MAPTQEPRGDAATAATTNVALCLRAIERAIQRPQHLPGLVGFYGSSGLGKSVGAAYAANQCRAYYIECRSSWTRKALLSNILKEMAIKPAATVYEMADQAAEELALSERPLIIDEFDHLVDRNLVEIIRDLHEGAGGAAILIIGEEKLEANLRRYERFHNRILDWVPAQPATTRDARLLADMHCRNVAIQDDLVEALRIAVRGITRRITVNLERINEIAAVEDWDTVDLKRWGDRGWFDGGAPARRR